MLDAILATCALLAATFLAFGMLAAICAVLVNKRRR